VDACTDIFAFGAVLHEMVSGRRAFSGASKQATLAAVLRDEPPPLAHVPHELEKLIARCLRKDPGRRAQHMADLKLELEQMKEESESGFSASGIAMPAAVSPKRGWLIPALAAVAVLGASGVYWKVRRSPDRSAPEMQPVVLTSYTGQQRSPALSPDGKQVAFSWDGERGDNVDIYVKLVDAGAPLRLTQAPEDDNLPAWSPDGRFLAFVRLSKQGKGGYYVIPALGGAERKVADIPQTPSHRPYPSVDWTPDSKSLVIVDTAVDPPALAEVSIAEGDKKRLTTPPANSLGDYLPAVSPDGKWLAFDRVPGVSLQSWQVVPFAQAISSRPSPILIAGPSPLSIWAGGGLFSRASWASDSAYLIAVEVASGGSRLVRVSIPGSERSEPILAAGTNASEPSIARQNGRLAYAHSFRNTNLWRVDLRNPTAGPDRVIASTRFEAQPDYSPDGTRVVFVSDRSGNREVWTAGADGASPLQITVQAATPTAPRWSPDGRRIVFAQRPGGNVDIYVVDAQGGTPRRLTTDPANDASAYWSRDGKWIYFASNRTGRQEVWKLPADGSTREVQVTRNGGWRSRESFDGNTLYFQKFDQVGLFRMPMEGGAEERIAEVQPPQDWQVAPDAIYYFQPVGEGYTVRKVDLKSGKTTEALKLPPGTAGGTANFTVSPDGRWLIFAHADQMVSELMMLDNFR
jgi:Tol biopolymer transport system component